ncbi:MAG TPA: TlpA disulfide reductase family protein [Flavisolibacter sp.]|nr:TlpA disulfide reductase family protein [Flavisolibacter sp.]
MMTMLVNESKTVNVLLAMLIAICGCTAPDQQKTTIPKEKRLIAKPMLTDLDSKPIDLAQFEGKTIFLNFWATWCKPCIYEMPSIKRAQDSLHNRGVIFLLASDESSEEIREFQKNNTYHFNYARVMNLEELGIQGLPTTYIFSPAGELVFSETGFRKWDDSSNMAMILKINSKR